MDLSHLLNASGAAPGRANSQVPLPAVPAYADGETRGPTTFAARASAGAPMRRPRWPPAAPAAANGWDMGARSGRGAHSFAGHEYKVDHTGTPVMGRAQHNFTQPNFTPMIPEGPPNFSSPDIFTIAAQNLSTPRNYSLPAASTPFPHHPPLPAYGAADIVHPRRAAMKRTASFPPGSDRRRKRVPMRSIGAPVMRAGPAYPPSPESDLDESLMGQSIPHPREPVQPFAPTHFAHLNGNGALVGNGSANGHVRSIGDTHRTPKGFVNGSSKAGTSGAPHGNARAFSKRVSNGIGNTVIIDLTDEPSDSSLGTAKPSYRPPLSSAPENADVVILDPPNPSRTPSRTASGVNGIAMRKPRPSKSATPISPAARWEAKMEARNSSAGPSSKAGPSKAGPSSKSGLSAKPVSSSGPSASNGVSARHTAPAPPLLPNGPAPAVVKKRKKRVRKKKLPPPDPDVPYPKFSENFGDIPKEVVGGILQIYDFCMSFAKVLRLSPFSFRSFELALSAQERNPLIDNIVVRLVRTMLEDKAVSGELDVSATTAAHLKTGKSAGAAEKTFMELPHLFSIDERDDEESFVDETLRDVVLKMRTASSAWALYEVLSPTERLRVLCELVDRTASTEVLRACVINSIEFEDEERRRVREDLFAQRRQAETELKDARAELLALREKHGLLPSAIAAAAEAKAKEEEEKAAAAVKKNSKSKKKSKSKSAADPPRKKTRKELIVAAQKERAEAIKRRAIQREEENFLQRIESLKAKITSIKARTAKPGAKKRESVDDEEISPEQSAARAAAAQAEAEAEVHLDRAERNQDDPVRMHALGEDREHRRYWYVAGGGRLWVENPASKSWMHAEEPDLIDRLLKWCSPHREPERALKTVLQKRKLEIDDGMKTLAKMKEKEKAARERKANAPRTRAGKRKSRDSLNGTGTSAADVADAPYLAYRNSLA